MKNQWHFFRFAVLTFFIGSTLPCTGLTNYYSNSTGDLSKTSSWGINTNGTGTAPANFTAANQVFNIVNNTAPTIGANWTVSGTGSYIVVGNGTTACNFQIPAAYTCTGTINVSANATLSIANTTNPTLGTLNASSTVVFNGTSNQTIPAVTYGNLTYSGTATGTMAGGCTISGTLNVSNGTLVLDNSNTANYTYTVGSFTVTTPDYVDFGSGTNGSATMNLLGNLSQTGNGYIFTSGSASNGTLNFSGTAQNAQEALAAYVNYVVLSGSTVTFTGNFTFGGISGYTGYFTVNSGGTLNCGTYEILSAARNTLTVFTLSSGATLITANTAGIASSGTSGSLQAGTETFSSGANYTYIGSAAQTTGIFTTTPTAGTINNLTINNSSATGVTLSQAESLAGVLTLTEGLLNTTTTNLITVNNGGSTTGASNSSFVNGPITKIGNQAFTFPVGAAGTGYIPIGISAPATTTDAFLAQYNRSSGAALGPVTAAGLNHVSACDYWTLNHTAGSSAVNVTGYWNANSPCGGTYVNDVATIALAHFNGTSWNAWGNNALTGTTASGSVTWDNVSTFSPFALSSTSLFDPLPITLVDFNAQWQTGGTAALTWEVAQGVSVNHFVIQRSPDGVSWQAIGALDANGGSSIATTYSYTDADPLSSLNYYRLQLVDDAGSDTYSGVKVLSRSSGNGIAIFPNPATDHINVSFGTASPTGIVTLRLLNTGGQVLLQKKLTDPAGETISLPVSAYPAGCYLVQVLSSGGVQQSGIVLLVK